MSALAALLKIYSKHNCNLFNILPSILHKILHYEIYGTHHKHNPYVHHRPFGMLKLNNWQLLL
jgi:hypothetical protein